MFRIEVRRLPDLSCARELCLSGFRTVGAERNESYMETLADWSRADAADRALALDPQTSGGLLLAVPPGALAGYLSAVPGACEIGAVESAGSSQIVLG
jgi:selenide,water dikinase